jgi:hypothetical protein
MISTKILFLVSVIMISLVLPCFRVLGNERDSFNAQSDQTLYFQTSTYYSWYYMNTTMSNGQIMNTDTSFVDFISPYLAESFTFQTITITLYHEEVLERGSYYLTVTLDFYDTHEMPHEVTSSVQTMNIGSTVTSLTEDFNTLLLTGERLIVEVNVFNTLGLGLQIYWGNSTYPSQISYQGTAVFVPEFKSLLILPIFMIATLLAVIIYRKRIVT